MKKKWHFCLFETKVATKIVSSIIFPCIYVLQPQLVHIYFSSLFFSPFLIVVSAGLRVIYTPIQRIYQPYSFLIYLLLPYPSHMLPSTSVNSFFTILLYL
jgi:hypothetical protein